MNLITNFSNFVLAAEAPGSSPDLGPLLHVIPPFTVRSIKPYKGQKDKKNIYI